MQPTSLTTPSSVTARVPKLRAPTKRRLLGTTLMVGSLIVTVLLVLKSGSHNPLPPLDSWLLGVMAAALQIAAGYNFSAVGKVDPSLAKSSVRALITLGDQAERARLLAEEAFETGNAQSRYQALGKLSVYLSVIEDSASLAADSWGDVHEDAVAEILRDAKKSGDNINA